MVANRHLLTMRRLDSPWPTNGGEWLADIFACKHSAPWAQNLSCVPWGGLCAWTSASPHSPPHGHAPRELHTTWRHASTKHHQEGICSQLSSPHLWATSDAINMAAMQDDGGMRPLLVCFVLSKAHHHALRSLQ